MADQKSFVAEGVVTENLPNTMFRVKIGSVGDKSLIDQLLLCTVAGRLRLHYVRLMPGDRVRLEISPLDKTRGRIVYKIK
jgi:translation initiation factor IF-1